jgi:hypothetical protein
VNDHGVVVAAVQGGDMSHDKTTPARVRWARLRFAIIGPLLSAPAEAPLPVAAWINKPVSATAPAQPADQRAPTGPQAGEALDQVPASIAVDEAGLITAIPAQ